MMRLVKQLVLQNGIEKNGLSQWYVWFYSIFEDYEAALRSSEIQANIYSWLGIIKFWEIRKEGI